jgi:Flp pilus assembly pilin Flp
MMKGTWKKFRRQLGQGMTEYIIIVAVVALGSIAVYTAFGDVLRGQVAEAASTLAGEKGEGKEKAKQAAQNANANINKTMQNYSDTGGGGGGGN